MGSDVTEEFKAFEDREKKLLENYQETWKEILGNIESFYSALIGEEGANTFRDKWRKQLNNNIAKKIGK